MTPRFLSSIFLMALAAQSNAGTLYYTSWWNWAVEGCTAFERSPEYGMFGGPTVRALAVDKNNGTVFASIDGPYGPMISKNTFESSSVLVTGVTAGQLTADASGNVYATSADAIIKINPSGEVSTASSFLGAVGLVFDGNGTLYASRGNTLNRVAADGSSTQFATLAASAWGPLVMDSQGNFLTGTGLGIEKVTPSGDASVYFRWADVNPRGGLIDGIAIDETDGIYFATTWTQSKTVTDIYRYAPDGTITGAGVAMEVGGIMAYSTFGPVENVLVPEPSAATLTGLGLLMLVLRKRR